MFTLNQAAKEAKKSKATLLDAIRAGRLSAAKDEQGRYQIDPAELFRVYPASVNHNTQTEQDATPQDAALLRLEIESLRKELADLKEDRDAWRECAKIYTTTVANLSELVRRLQNINGSP
jgi:uncharacterized protein YlxW (UPF0749 family)